MLPIKEGTTLRVLYMMLAVWATAYTLSIYAPLLQQFITVTYSFKFELAMVLGQLVFQSVFIFRRPFTVKFLYAFHLLTVSLLGSLLLWVVICLKQLVYFNTYVCLGYFLLVVGFMFFEHRRRLNVLKLPLFLSYTWLLYRSIILIFIL